MATPKYTLAGCRVHAKCVNVYDGDTAQFVFAVPQSTMGLRRFSCRMMGYNSAELRGSTPAEKIAAIAAREALTGLILGKELELDICGEDKYGRLLVKVCGLGFELDQYMISGGHGAPYSGRGPKLWSKVKVGIDGDESTHH